MAAPVAPAATAPERSDGRAAIAARTLRRTGGGSPPAISFSVLFAFIIYATYAAIVNRRLLLQALHLALLLAVPGHICGSTSTAPSGCPRIWHLRTWWVISPAIIILIFPLGFRLTCYYYRRAYYRAFWQSPPACAVGRASQAATAARPASR